AFGVATPPSGLQSPPAWGAAARRAHGARTDSFAESGGGSEALMRDLQAHGPDFLRHAQRFFESVALFLMPVDRINAGIPKDISH
ncbi:MAG: hypothetical protein VXX86_07055, partial [Planctomycetota bacterium]|nr:hypothetical protein [Planctomycetota bacterium]